MLLWPLQHTKNNHISDNSDTYLGGIWQTCKFPAIVNNLQPLPKLVPSATYDPSGNSENAVKFGKYAKMHKEKGVILKKMDTGTKSE